jgi:hypothetical protein
MEYPPDNINLKIVWTISAFCWSKIGSLPPFQHIRINKIAAGKVNLVKHHAADCRVPEHAVDNLAESPPFFSLARPRSQKSAFLPP